MYNNNIIIFCVYVGQYHTYSNVYVRNLVIIVYYGNNVCVGRFDSQNLKSTILYKTILCSLVSANVETQISKIYLDEDQ